MSRRELTGAKSLLKALAAELEQQWGDNGTQ
jgi:hypothetical protein